MNQKNSYGLMPSIFGFPGMGMLIFLMGETFELVALFLRHGDIAKIYELGVGTGVLGCGLLFLARLPLYRQRRFFLIGPKALDRAHRRLYWLAYGVVFISLVVLADVCVRVR